MVLTMVDLQCSVYVSTGGGDVLCLGVLVDGDAE